MVPEWEPLAVRLPARSSAEPWVVPSEQLRGRQWEAWLERQLDTPPVKRSIQCRRANWGLNVRNLLARNPYSDCEAAYRWHTVTLHLGSVILVAWSVGRCRETLLGGALSRSHR